MASTACSEALESWTLAAEWITESGMPLRSTITWRFEPDLPLSVGFAPLFWPPGSGHARRVQRCPLPVDLVRLAQTVQELTVQPLPHARFLPLLEASPTHQHRVGAVLDSLRQVELLSEEGWKRISAGEGSKGPCLYDWLRLPLNPPLQEGFERWLLVRRSVEDPEELTAYTVFCVEGTTLGALARVAGSRWRVEIAFEEAKGEVGLAHYEVRSWHGWYRHVTLSLFAHAFLAAIRAEGIDIEASQKGAPKPEGKDGLLAFKRKRGLSCN